MITEELRAVGKITLLIDKTIPVSKTVESCYLSPEVIWQWM